MRNKIFGGIGIIWGGLIVLNWLLSGETTGDSAYAAGQTAAAVLGLLMFVAGIYYVRKKPEQNQINEKTESE